MTESSADEPADERARDIADMKEVLSLAAFPLSKRELLAAFFGMGLASRLQPLHVTNNRESVAAQTNVIALSFQLADMAIAESDKNSKI